MLSDSRIHHYFNLADNASQFSDFKQHKLGAVLFYKGKTISIGWNSNKTSPLQKQYNRLRGYDVESAHNSLHAEMACLLKAKDMNGIDFSKTSLFISRKHKDGIVALSKPCAACAKMIRDMGIKNVYYTGENSWCYERIG